jgi:hypothetical protein
MSAAQQNSLPTPPATSSQPESALIVLYVCRWCPFESQSAGSALAHSYSRGHELLEHTVAQESAPQEETPRTASVAHPSEQQAPASAAPVRPLVQLSSPVRANSVRRVRGAGGRHAQQEPARRPQAKGAARPLMQEVTPIRSGPAPGRQTQSKRAATNPRPFAVLPALHRNAVGAYTVVRRMRGTRKEWRAYEGFRRGTGSAAVVLASGTAGAPVAGRAPWSARVVSTHGCLVLEVDDDIASSVGLRTIAAGLERMGTAFAQLEQDPLARRSLSSLLHHRKRSKTVLRRVGTAVAAACLAALMGAGLMAAMAPTNVHAQGGHGATSSAGGSR